MNYAKSNPDLVILAVNTFVKVTSFQEIESVQSKRYNPANMDTLLSF